MFSPDGEHKKLYQRKPLFAFDETQDFETQKQRLRAKLRELLGDEPQKVDPAPALTLLKETETYTDYRLVFQAEAEVQAVCRFLLPKTDAKKIPLTICLQGHSTGMHISLGEEKYPGDKDDGDRNIAMQAISRGYAALCVEQRGMGERRSDALWDPARTDDGRPRCRFTAMNALLLGRTLIGERCFDISRALDVALELFPQLDAEKIICTGNSGGGTATYYASCMDERIAVSMPSCAVCTYKDSIGAMYHCDCNYIPGSAKYFDMGDLALLIAPRKLIVINGREDPIFPEPGVIETYETIKKIYHAAGAPDHCALVTGDGGHRYYKAPAWAAFDKMDALR